jgi:putative tricarboxylic transport membrane protein
MRRRNFISSIILLAIAMAIILEAKKLPFGTLGSPNMGFFPLILGTLLAILSVILFGQATKEKGEGSILTGVTSGSWKKIGLAAVALFAFAFLFEFLGYMISTFLLIAFLSLAIGSQKWWLAILAAFISSVVSYLIFGLLLGASLPAGILGV